MKTRLSRPQKYSLLLKITAHSNSNPIEIRYNHGLISAYEDKATMKVSLPAFEKARVLVVGDVMLDRYWVGPTGRIAPEAPVPFAPRCILQACGNYSDQIYRDID